MSDAKTSPGRSWSGVLVKEMAVGELSEKQETKVWKWHHLASGIVFSVATGGWRLSLQISRCFSEKGPLPSSCHGTGEY